MDLVMFYKKTISYDYIIINVFNYNFLILILL